MSNASPQLRGVILAIAGVPTYSPDLTVHRYASEVMARGDAVLASTKLAHTDSYSGKKFPRIITATRPSAMPERAYIESETAIVKITPFMIDQQTYIFVVEK